MTNKNNNYDSKNIKNKIYIKQENVYINTLKKQYFELKMWKMRIEIISNMKNKEIQKRDKQIIEMV